MAVDAETGKYRWHYQQVHHDIWDYDGPSPVVLFDVDGKKGLAQASKTGWLYLLDRETGKPLLPIPEQPVPQLASQKTAKTQPIPSYPPFIPQKVTAENVQNVGQLKLNGPAKDLPVKAAKEMYTPFDDKAITVVVPGPQGGTNWQPTSYNPETEMFYVCAQAAFSGLVLSHAAVPPGKQGSVADLGGSFVTTGFGDHPGYFSAIDAHTGEIKWQKRWPESCYSGSVTTGGGLVFVGRNNGDLEAYDAETGEGPLWSFQTGAGANSTVTSSSRTGRSTWPSSPAATRSRRRRTATTSGSSRSTARWTRSRRAARARAPATPARPRPSRRAARATPPRARPSGPTTAPAATASPAPAATAARASSTTRTRPTRPRSRAQVTNGGGGMPSFKDTLTEQQINDVAAYVSQDIAKP